MADHHLHEVKPREQAGPQTGALYEYQYHQAAAEALSLLTDESAICIYCEWHDDFVKECQGAACYAFHQVKTRTKSRGPWTLTEFFGLKRSPAAEAETDSIFAKMWDHTVKFGHRCKRFTFVTDAGINAEFGSLLKAIEHCDQPQDLPAAERKSFDRILKQTTSPLGTAELTLFDFLKRFTVNDALGAVTELADLKLTIAGRILEASEVNLEITEARKIGENLVSEIRRKSHVVLEHLPGDLNALRAAKALTIEDVVKTLSLSIEGYKQLRAKGREAVVTVSRLHRLCRKNSVPDQLIPVMCDFKVAWASWWMTERENLNPLDVAALKLECATALKLHNEGSRTFEQLIDDAAAIAAKFVKRLTSAAAITGEHVLGLIIDLAVGSEI